MIEGGGILKMSRALIFNEDYFEIDNHDFAAEEYIRARLPVIDAELVGSFGKKAPGEKSKDLDYVTSLNAEELIEVLTANDKKYFHYAGLRTFSTTEEDPYGIPRKVDYFYVDDVDFATRAFYSHRYNETSYPSSTLPMLFTNMGKALYNEWLGHVSFSPATGLRQKVGDKKWKHISLNWDHFLALMKVDSDQPTVEDVIASIQKHWTKKQKGDLISYLGTDKKFFSYLESKGLCGDNVLREIMRDA